MNAKVTFLLALAMFAISTAMAEDNDHHGDHNNYYGAYNQGSDNNDYSSNVDTGVQEAVNVDSQYASNKNAGYNISAKNEVGNYNTAQVVKYEDSSEPQY